MKVLFVSRFNNILPNGLTPFVHELGDDITRNGITVDYFVIKGRGVVAYLKAIYKLNIYLKKNNYDIIHAHYGLSGIVAVLQIKTPVVVSLVGSDVNLRFNKFINRFTIYKLSKIVIFVSEKLKQKSGYKGNSVVIPYGVNLMKFFPKDKTLAINKTKLDVNKINILFASRFDRPEKNFHLAQKAISIISKAYNVNLVEFKNLGAEDLNNYYNACNLLLMTSLREGSPQVIKEALACNTPVVSTDVGDVKKVFAHTEGCYLTTFEPEDVADKIKKALAFSENKGRTQGRERLIELGLDAENVARKIVDVYNNILNK